MILHAISDYQQRGINASALITNSTKSGDTNDIRVQIPDEYDRVLERILNQSCLAEKYKRIGDAPKTALLLEA